MLTTTKPVESETQSLIKQIERRLQQQEQDIADLKRVKTKHLREIHTLSIYLGSALKLLSTLEIETEDRQLTELFLDFINQRKRDSFDAS